MKKFFNSQQLYSSSSTSQQQPSKYSVVTEFIVSSAKAHSLYTDKPPVTLLSLTMWLILAPSNSFSIFTHVRWESKFNMAKSLVSILNFFFLGLFNFASLYMCTLCTVSLNGIPLFLIQVIMPPFKEHLVGGLSFCILWYGVLFIITTEFCGRYGRS